MIKLRWTTQAVDDLEAIRSFIGNDSVAYADLVVARLLEAVKRLEHFPRSGRTVPELSDPQLREIIESPYRIVYRVRNETVEILTVFRASRLMPSVLGD
ncbi:MAG: type II toxin-antitoxin system RelE/ParE family toxin [Deltaproteobacteria bacterium]|nr:type II toxin-antitoxin system RelE/ParE family toxin [Deltaproteobacteria bacterium]NND28927.1 type II toxin-antitoxin system RelE/ParE family toxin [Myxococcales bacterium]MBT8464437.1 type II toxin-antitoxin system RelE/ParE family toxin [Deltaproteobacteria bacterium]MBT8480713.1 type II toxin-antitoxin system RelE/ParE family toxin [Deltaproteobacteria bacterium]NNK08429.1 type II toxin-antitoxin system RelE/ParE family toxin [Myxococcales bacterium]